MNAADEGSQSLAVLRPSDSESRLAPPIVVASSAVFAWMAVSAVFAWMAFGTITPLKFIFDRVTAPFLIFFVVTAFFFSCVSG
jgi:hypothetical protein